ncbi:helix-turn-helix transcriptional regulator [Halobacillus litoralis]|uniref:HTH araC/xylS-type domain-containing protein n=1 Tax=Halobacillus litoralis TaxID=45668 RepID=A0A410MD59_9BACI|nr:AraC family transcriptional regulator [Halobacillus litoralis]QAS52613.1 hypothetical protein HLI_10475 [Halobacillus litoralis]
MIWTNEQGLFLQRHDQLGERDWRYDDCFKLIFSPYGKGEYQTHDGDRSIGEEEFFIMNPKVEHKQLRATQEKFLVELTPSLLQEAAQKMGVHHTHIEFSTVSYRHRQMIQWATFMREFLSNQKEGVSALFLENSLVQLSILMVEYGVGSHQKELPISSGSEPVYRVISALKESYIEQWSLDEMAGVARMNKFQFAHAFKKETGLSPYSWLQVYRLFRSQQEIIFTEHSILSIAIKHGFANVAAFNHLFKKMYHKTPTQFRHFHKMNQ